VSARVAAGFTSRELRSLRALRTPYAIQRALDAMPYHHAGTAWSPRRVLHARTAHCLEGAVFAAAALRVLGFPPLLLDLEAVQDTDHVLAVYQLRGHWGAIAKSNFAGLRYREPVYRTVRELVLSYFESYINLRGERTLRAYSAPLNLARFDRTRPDWMTTDGPSLVGSPEHLSASAAALLEPGLVRRLPPRRSALRSMPGLGSATRSGRTTSRPSASASSTATSRIWRWTRSSTPPTRRCSAAAGSTARSTPPPAPSFSPSAGRWAAAHRARRRSRAATGCRRPG
jgi:hypothetical protein